MADLGGTELHLNVVGAWNHLHKVRQQVEDLIARWEPSMKRAGAMATGELLENATKYGFEKNGSKDIRLSVRVRPSAISIKVSNASVDPDSVTELRKRVDAIMAADDRQSLYMARLEEILENPEETGKLGLYRIGYEGGFDLECTYENAIVTVTATRSRGA